MSSLSIETLKLGMQLLIEHESAWLARVDNNEYIKGTPDIKGFMQTIQDTKEAIAEAEAFLEYVDRGMKKVLRVGN